MRVHPWQAPAWAQVRAMIGAGRLPHALLLTGPPGSGKADFAAALAALLLCPDAGGEQACGRCRSCALFAAGTHPDLLQVAPEDGGVQIRVDQVRAATDFAGLSLQLAPRKVILLRPADAMNTAAANALLKTLEEPPGATVLLLLASRAAALPATVLSRCTRLGLAARDEAGTGEVLDGLDAGEARAALALAAGAPLAARRYVEEGWLEARAGLAAGLLRLARDVTGLGAVSAECQALGFERLSVLLPALVRDVLVLGLAGREDQLINPDLAEALHAIAKRVDLARLTEVPGQVQALTLRKQAAPGLREEMLIDELLGFWAEVVGVKETRRQ